MAGVILRIQAPHEGYRRAGRAWSREPTEVEAEALTKDALASLRADFRLTIEEIAPPSEERGVKAEGGSLPLMKASELKTPHPSPLTPHGSEAREQPKKSKGK